MTLLNPDPVDLVEDEPVVRRCKWGQVAFGHGDCPSELVRREATLPLFKHNLKVALPQRLEGASER
jgi:hypothetical protein